MCYQTLAYTCFTLLFHAQLHDMLLYIPARKILLLARKVVDQSTPLLREVIMYDRQCGR